MDQALIDIMGGSKVRDARERNVVVRFLAPDKGAQGEIQVETPSGPQRYTLKSLRELYGKGLGAASVNPQDEQYEPLFMAIEQTIALYDDEVRTLTDGLVELTLEQMSMDPAGEPGQDELRHRIQLALRLLLSLDDYSRQEVRTALRTIARSVARHKSLEGRRGYLEFIHEFFG